MSKYSQKRPPDYAEPAIEVLRLVVAAKRSTGDKTIAALESSAPEFDAPPRRLRHLFERDRTPYVGIDEFGRFLLRGAGVLRGVASRLREAADRWDAEAEWMEKRHKDLRGNECWASHGDERSHRRAA